jgi:hypothetical protein
MCKDEEIKIAPPEIRSVPAESAEPTKSSSSPDENKEKAYDEIQKQS